MTVSDALDFSIFPSLLLITTLFRLGLNVSTTRAILGNNGNAGDVHHQQHIQQGHRQRNNDKQDNDDYRERYGVLENSLHGHCPFQADGHRRGPEFRPH